MPYYDFKKKNILRNTLITHPQYVFDINNGNIYLNTLSAIAGAYVSNVPMVPTGHISLYELNVDRNESAHTYDPEVDAGIKSLIFPFTVKDGGFNSIGTVTDATYNTSYQYGDMLTGSYPLSASIVRERFASGVARKHVSALKNTLNYYTYLSNHYSYSSSFGDKSTQEINLISIPSIFFDSGIKPGSVDLKFYIGGTMVAQATDKNKNGELIQVSGTAYAQANGSNSVAGVVLYNEGFILLTGSWELGPSLDTYESTTVSSGPFSVSGDSDFEIYAKGDWAGTYGGSQLSGSGSYAVSGTATASGSYIVSGSGDHSGSFSGSISYGTGSYCISGSGIIDLISGSDQFTGDYVIGTGSSTTISGSSGYNLTGTYASYYFCGSGSYYVSGSSIHTLSGSGVGSGSLATASYYILGAESYNITGAGDAYSVTGSGLSASFSGTGSMQVTGSGLYNFAGSASSDTFVLDIKSKPKWIDFGVGMNDGTLAGTLPSASFRVDFKGTNEISTLEMYALAPKGYLNHSSNPTYKLYDSGSIILTSSVSSSVYIEDSNVPMKNTISSSFCNYSASFKKQTFISKIGIFDDQRKLIAIANLATPVKKTEDRALTFKLKLDI